MRTTDEFLEDERQTHINQIKSQIAKEIFSELEDDCRDIDGNGYYIRFWRGAYEAIKFKYLGNNDRKVSKDLEVSQDSTSWKNNVESSSDSGINERNEEGE